MEKEVWLTGYSHLACSISWGSNQIWCVYYEYAQWRTRQTNLKHKQCNIPHSFNIQLLVKLILSIKQHVH